MVKYITWAEVTHLVADLIFKMKLDNWHPTLVVGLTRGGLMPATMISHAIKVDMTSLDVSLHENNTILGVTSSWLPELIKDDHHILIVDDVNNTGKTFEWIKQDWTSTVRNMNPRFKGLWPETHIKFAVLHHNQNSNFSTNYYGEKIGELDNIVYPWENWHLS